MPLVCPLMIYEKVFSTDWAKRVAELEKKKTSMHNAKGWFVCKASIIADGNYGKQMVKH